MSESYTHFLTPVSSDYRPAADAVATFIHGIIVGGHVAGGTTITFSKVTKGEPRVRQMRNAFTGGRTIDIPCPSRSVERPAKHLSSVSEITGLAVKEPEYDVSVASEGIPSHPPIEIGYSENREWKTMDDPYYLGVCCHVRASIVRLFSLKSKDDLHRPPDFANYRPRFDEDCTADERDGLFVHPETGAIRIPNAGCGMFWIGLEYGKSIYPRLRDGDISVLDDAVVDLARNAFGTDFVQACDWG